MDIYVPPYRVEYVPTGTVVTASAGSFFLTHRSGPASRIIGLGERLRSKTRPYAYWTHCGVFLNEQGDIVEALTAGVTKDNISVYKDIPYAIVHIQANDTDVVEMMQYLMYCIGEEYNWLEILAAGINMVTGSTISLGVDGHQICSALVASTMTRAGAIFDMSADHITPADLGRYFNVPTPPALNSTNLPTRKV